MAHDRAREWLGNEWNIPAAENKLNVLPEKLDAYAAHILRELAERTLEAWNNDFNIADWLRAEAERLEGGE